MNTTIRDHGVFSSGSFTTPPPTTIETAKLKRDQTAAQKAELDARLAPLLDKIQAGTATAEEMSVVTELAEDSRILADRLHHANVELRVAEEKAGREQTATARARFNYLVANSRQRRDQFNRLYREASIALGALCANVDEATQIVNSFAAGSVVGLVPLDRNAVTEMSENPDPLPALLDSGFAPTVGFGWNFRLAIVPLKGKI
jgi:hypothetical protein